MKDEFQKFLLDVPQEYRTFVVALDTLLSDNGCHHEIKQAKSGYVVSYVYKDTKRTLAVYVFRKSGVKIKLYAEHIADYQDFLATLPEGWKKDIHKASICKRMLDPTACNPRCSMGYTFTMQDTVYKKCRHMAFMPTLSKENNPYIERFLMQEINVH